MTLTDDSKAFIIKKGSNLDYGARPLRRAIENYIEDPLSEELLKGEFEGKNNIVVDTVKDDEGKIKRLNFASDFIEESGEEPVGAVTGEDPKSSSKSRPIGDGSG